MNRVIIVRNVHLDINSVVQATEMGYIVVETILDGKIDQIHMKNVPIKTQK